MLFSPPMGLTFPLITLEPEHIAGCGLRPKRANSMAFLDYMGVPVRRSSSWTPTSKHSLKMLLSSPTGLTFSLITLEPEHIVGCGWRLKRAPSMAFLDYMGVSVRRASSRIPTSKHRLKMLFSRPTGLTFPLITLEPEHIVGCGRRLKRAPSMAFLDYMGVPVRRASSRIPTSKHRLKMLFSRPTGLTFPLLTLEPKHPPGCGWRLKRAPSMAFLDYMGVPVRRASSRIPTSKHRLKMFFSRTMGLTFSLITLEPEHIAGCGLRLKRAPSMAFLDYMGVPVCCSSSRTPTSKHRLKMLYWTLTGLTIPLITSEPEHIAGC